MAKDKSLSVDNITKIIERLDLIKDIITDGVSDSIEIIANNGAKYATSLNQSTPVDVGTDDTRVEKTVDEYSATISLKGRDSVYKEFGTGQKGLDSPHPLKSNFALNDYNSGPVVRKNIELYGKAFWHYAGKKTTGMPSGKIMYNTSIYLRENANKIVANTINDNLKHYEKI